MDYGVPQTRDQRFDSLRCKRAQKDFGEDEPIEAISTIDFQSLTPRSPPATPEIFDTTEFLHSAKLAKAICM